MEAGVTAAQRGTRDGGGQASRFQSISLRNLLSFGAGGASLDLDRLNVLVGPNGSGKSNVLEAIALIRGTAGNPGGDFRDVVVRGGGAPEFIWKGAPRAVASLDFVLSISKRPCPLRHAFSFSAVSQTLRIEEERIENENERPVPGKKSQPFFYHLEHGRAVINQGGDDSLPRVLTGDSVDTDRSIVAQRRDPEGFPDITHLASVYESIRLYREWTFGRDSVLRQPQKADVRSDRLDENFSNLGLFLNRLRRQPKAKAAVLEGLRDLYEGFTDFDVSIEGGTVQVFFTEGDFVIPATRLSDGTVRYLCLLAILCDPEPPPLIGIEEPELGLHPDLLPKVADLLVAASARTQLIVTTHSDILIDALTEWPESVVIVEKHAGQTSMQRLDVNNLRTWLEKYRLGQLWTRGDLGGTRW